MRNANTVQTCDLQIELMYKWWIYVVHRCHCGHWVAKIHTELRACPFLKHCVCIGHSDLCQEEYELKTVDGFIWFDQFLMLNTPSFCPTKHSAILFLCETAAVISDFQSVKHQTRFQGLCKYIRHSAPLSPVILPGDYPAQQIFKTLQSWKTVTSLSERLLTSPARWHPSFFHSLRTWHAGHFFEKKLSGHKSNHLRTLNLSCKNLMLHVLSLFLPGLLSSARFKLRNSLTLYHLHLFSRFISEWSLGGKIAKLMTSPNPFASGRRGHLKSLWGHSAGSQWPGIFANSVSIPRNHGSEFPQLFSNRCCCKQNVQQHSNNYWVDKLADEYPDFPTQHPRECRINANWSQKAPVAVHEQHELVDVWGQKTSQQHGLSILTWFTCQPESDIQEHHVKKCHCHYHLRQKMLKKKHNVWADSGWPFF